MAALGDLAFGVAAAAIAVTNERSHWLGASAWTVAAAAVALIFLVGVLGDLDHARR